MLRHMNTLFSFKSKHKPRRKRIRMAQLTQNSIFSLRPVDTLQNVATVMRRRRGGDELLRKGAILFSFCTRSILVAS